MDGSTIRIKTGEIDTGDVPMDMVGAALKVLRRRNETERCRTTAEMFSKEETGEAAADGVAAAELKQFIERIERLEEEKAAVAGDVKEVFGELKARGFDPGAVRTILRLRKKPPEEREEERAILDLYMQALGME
ncbi:GapR family DNA-binding domain-containing protein [Chelatococcus sp. XZ-Ab1]|uniref:GapR family DNA-binding domain-containing protein n=1 Tax=Chelatococcus sp. XZ-Ab1 TaxID=3034027 RepID=UPI0023E3D516|nr:GapR family DNA-binding domain-containing protein [Chelatococcus sp. XZ-Ab1]